MTAERIRRAAALMRERARAATPGPWRDSTVDDNRYGALVADQPHPDRKKGGGWDWEASYGGCLIGESLMAADRRHIASWDPCVAMAVAYWLDLVARLLDAGFDPNAETQAALTVAETYLKESA